MKPVMLSISKDEYKLLYRLYIMHRAMQPTDPVVAELDRYYYDEQAKREVGEVSET